jgi:hypothetical protein
MSGTTQGQRQEKILPENEANERCVAAFFRGNSGIQRSANHAVEQARVVQWEGDYRRSANPCKGKTMEKSLFSSAPMS